MSKEHVIKPGAYGDLALLLPIPVEQVVALGYLEFAHVKQGERGLFFKRGRGESTKGPEM